MPQRELPRPRPRRSTRDALQLRQMFRINFDRRAKAVQLAWASVEASRDGVEVVLRQAGQIRAFRQILPQQSIRVLVGAALPGAVWVSEIDGNACGRRQILVPAHLLALIVGHGLAHRSVHAIEDAGEARECCIGGTAAFHASQQNQAAGAFDERSFSPAPRRTNVKSEWVRSRRG